MKKLLSILAGALVACAALAEGPSMVHFLDASIQTNGASVTTQTPDPDGFLSGWVDTVVVDITAGASNTNTVTLTTLAGQGTGAARTILTLSNVSADGVYPVRDLITGQTGSDIANVPARVPLVQDKLRLTAVASGSDTNATAATMTVYVIMSPRP